MGKTFKPINEMTQEEKDAELDGYLAAGREHVIDRGYRSEVDLLDVYIDVPVLLKFGVGTGTIELPSGTYFVTPYSEENPYSGAIWAITFASEKALEATIEQLEEVTAGEPVQLDLTITPFELIPGRYITISDVIAWIAANQAEDPETAWRVIRLAYPKANLPEFGSEEAGRRSYNVKKGGRHFPIDPVTKAIFDPHNPNHYGLEDYWNDGRAKEIPIGKGGSLSLLITPPEDADITRPQTYELNLDVLFWLHHAYSVAVESGAETISGPDILQSAGISNPWAASSAPLMDEAYRSLRKCITSLIAYETIGERRETKRGKYTLTGRLTERTALDAGLSVNRWEDGEGGRVMDFDLEGKGAPLEQAFNIFKYGIERGMVARLPKERILEVKNAHIAARKMFHYVEMRLAEKGTSNTILYETLFTAMGLPANTKAEKQRRERLRDKLAAALDGAKKAGRIKHWRYHKDKAGHRDGVEIVKKDE